MGSDGAEGLRAIIASGGVGVAQIARECAVRLHAALRDGHRRWRPGGHAVRVAAAGAGGTGAQPGRVARGAADAVPPVAGIARRAAEDDPSAALQTVLRLLLQTTGHDFAQYKPSTLRRRIERRMALHGTASMADYARLLAASSQEGELLFKELLIGVTAFFRDPPFWQSLAASVLPTLAVQGAARPEPELRAWVVGCSTGEEAYTLAMLLHEAVAAAALPQQLKLQVFATDLSADAVQTARRGLYPEALVQGVSAVRLSRFFVREAGGYRVSKALRDMVLFARHDVIGDPPFMRLDIVSCRNLLIYFKPALQHKLLPLFHYVLRPGGTLLLGNSETVGRFESLFAPLDIRWRMYRRSDTGCPLADGLSAQACRPATLELRGRHRAREPRSRSAAVQSFPNQV
jgi:two-component system CheB/CheR fusion protein